jgi:uncharacterized membrane protein YkvA (DUF1232 family)
VPRIRGAFIEPPVALEPATKAAVLQQLTKAIESVDDAEARYVDERLPQVLVRLKKQGGWYGDMAQVAEVLKSYCDRGPENAGTSDRCRRIAIAALFYLCEPFDVVPDYVPGKGYVDDALVLNQAVTELRAANPRVAAWLRSALKRHKYTRIPGART